MAIALLVGCHGGVSRTFSTPEFTPTREVWRFHSRDGTHLSSPHFDVYTTLNDAELVDFLPVFLETTYQFYTSLLSPPADRESPPPRMETYVLGNREEWDAFVKRRFPNRYGLYRKISAGGFSEGNVCVVYDIGRAATLSVLAHEGLHQYFGANFSQPLPAWLNEGLATYCEAVEFRGQTPHFTPENNTFRVNHLCDALSSDSALPLKDLLATNAGEVIEGNRAAATATYYAEAWALVVFLQHGAGGQYAGGFRAMLDDIANGTILIKSRTAKATSENPSEASYGESVFAAYFPGALDSFEQEYLQFARRLCWDK